jgi:hypothetical protein
MMSTAAIFPQYETKVYQTSRRKNKLSKVVLTSFATAPDNLYVTPYPGRSFAPVATWNLHTTQPKYFAPTNSEVVNLTGLL